VEIEEDFVVSWPVLAKLQSWDDGLCSWTLLGDALMLAKDKPRDTIGDE
jgi:hypothetical protein